MLYSHGFILSSLSHLFSLRSPSAPQTPRSTVEKKQNKTSRFGDRIDSRLIQNDRNHDDEAISKVYLVSCVRPKILGSDHSFIDIPGSKSLPAQVEMPVLGLRSVGTSW